MKQQYEFFFQQQLKSLNSVIKQRISPNVLQRHKIKIIDPEDDEYMSNVGGDGSFFVNFVKSSLNGFQCCYQVIIGKFYLIVNVLNLHENSGIKEKNWEESQKLGEGSFGIVRLLRIQDKEIAVKHLVFDKKHYEIEMPEVIDLQDYCSPYSIKQAIKQYCIYKICSMLKIGPQVIFNDVFDLICYNDGIQFHMELCQKVFNQASASYQQDIKDCVSILHGFNFVHRDIKPVNTLYSPSLKKYVLSDFGTAKYISEGIQRETLTYFVGTDGYAGPQMMSLLADKKKPGFVNLYLNDFYGVKVTFSKVKTVKYIESQSSSSNYNNSSSSYTKHQFSEFGIQRTESQNNELSESQEISIKSGNSVSQQMSISSSDNIKSLYSWKSEGKKTKTELNFYLMKFLSTIVILKSVDNYEISKQITERQRGGEKVLYEKIITCYPGFDNHEFYENLYKKSRYIFVPDENQEIIRKLRNLIRIFGQTSAQFLDRLEFYETIGYPLFEDRFRLNEKMEEIKKKIEMKQAKKRFNAKNFINYYMKKDLKNLFRQLRSLLHNQEIINFTSHEEFRVIIKSCLLFIQYGYNNYHQVTYQFKNFIDKLISKGRQLNLEEQQFNIIGKLPAKVYLHNDSCSFPEIIKVKYEMAAHTQRSLIENRLYLNDIQIVFSQMTFLYMFDSKEKVRDLIIDSFQSAINGMKLQKQKYCSQKYLNLVMRVKLGFVNVLSICQYFTRMNEILHEIQISSEMAALKNFPLQEYFYRLKTSHSININNFEEGFKFNQLWKKKFSQYFFPKQNITMIRTYLVNLGKLFKKSSEEECIKFFLKAEQLYDETQLQVDQTFIMVTGQIYKWYSKIGNRKQERKYLIKFVLYLIYGPLQKNMDYKLKLSNLGYLIKLQISENRVTILRKLFSIFFQLKFKTCEYDLNIYNVRVALRQVHTFALGQEQNSKQISRQTMIETYKIIAFTLERWLPISLDWYRGYLNIISCYYINELNCSEKALPYLWKYFSKYPLQSIKEDKQYFQKIIGYARMLIQHSFAQKALLFLQKYIYRIPNEFLRIKQSGFKYLEKLSQSQQRGKYKNIYYKIVCKFRPFENESRYSKCQWEIKNSKEINRGIKKAWLKKLKYLDEYIEFNHNDTQTWDNDSLRISEIDDDNELL